MRGGSPKQMEAMMRRMGIKTENVDATEVIIVKRSGKIILKDPSVTIMTVQGQKTYQISGREVIEGGKVSTKKKGKKSKKKKKKKKAEVEEEPGPEPEPEEEEISLPFTDGDIRLVMEQTGCSEQRAKKALEKSGGAPAEAILLIMSEG
jgi:nascent polypeptide-associated complex subunit alpha